VGCGGKVGCSTVALAAGAGCVAGGSGVAIIFVAKSGWQAARITIRMTNTGHLAVGKFLE
jgi:uncharacterized protein YraI